MIMISLISLACSGVMSLIWGVHSFPYPSKAKKKYGERTFASEGGFWSVIYDGFIVYKRETGEVHSARAKPLKGLLYAGIVAVLWLLLTFPVLRSLVFFEAVHSNCGISVYCCALAFILTFVFPDQLVKHAGLPGRWTDLLLLKEMDFPFGPSAWGALISSYSIALVFSWEKAVPPNKLMRLLDLFGQIPAISKYGTPGLPLVWFAGILGAEGFLMRKSPPGRSSSWLFIMSWIIGMVTCIAMAVYLKGL